MTADIRLVPHTAQRHAHIFPLQGAGDALPDAGLARARSADKQQDRTRLLTLEAHHGQLLDDALLDLFQPVVILVEHLGRLVERDILRLFLLPGQGGEKVEVVVQHGRFRALSFVLEPGEHLVGLLAGGLVHAGFLDFDLQLSQIGHVLRMQLVQLVLQVFHLLFDGLFPVELLVILLLGVGGFAVDLAHLEVLINQLLQQIRAFGETVLGQHGIALGVGVEHPRAHQYRRLGDAVPLGNKSPRGLPPLEVLGKFHRRALDALQPPLRILRVEIVYVRPAGDGQVDAVVTVDRHVVEVDAVGGAQHQVAVGVDLGNARPQANGIKAVRREVLTS